MLKEAWQQQSLLSYVLLVIVSLHMPDVDVMKQTKTKKIDCIEEAYVL